MELHRLQFVFAPNKGHVLATGNNRKLELEADWWITNEHHSPARNSTRTLAKFSRAPQFDSTKKRQLVKFIILITHRRYRQDSVTGGYGQAGLDGAIFRVTLGNTDRP